AAEVLLGDDVRRRLRPEFRELDAALLERRAVTARDHRVADLPFDLVERVAARDREKSAHAEARGLVDDGVYRRFGRLYGACFLLYAGHSALPNCSLVGLVPAGRGPGRVGRASDGTKAR